MGSVCLCNATVVLCASPTRSATLTTAMMVGTRTRSLCDRRTAELGSCDACCLAVRARREEFAGRRKACSLGEAPPIRRAVSGRGRHIGDPVLGAPVPEHHMVTNDAYRPVAHA